MLKENRTVVLVLCVCSFLSLHGQSTGDVYYKRLYYLCKAWGHAKYYHPRIADGSVNWDDKLLATVVMVKNANNDADFNTAVLQMLASAGPTVTPATPAPVAIDSLNNNLDTSWIGSIYFSSDVKLILNDIKSKFSPVSNKYVGKATGASNPTFDNDNQYYLGYDVRDEQSYYPDEGKRLLALFRFWNIIHYFYPYKKLMDQPWDKTLEEFIPRIAGASDKITFHLAFKELMARLNDTHGFFISRIFNQWRGGFSPPFLISFIENETVITKVKQGISSIAVGDIIREIDGVKIQVLRDSLRKYSFGSTQAAVERNLNDLILAGPSGLFSLTVDNGRETHTASFSRDGANYNALAAITGPAWKKLSVNDRCNFAVVNLAILKPADVPALFQDVINTDAIIFDVRNYPLGTLWTMIGYLFDAPVNIANFTVPDNTFAGKLDWHKEILTPGSRLTPVYKGKVILLFNEITQSQAEYTVMGLEQFPGAIKIGSTTAGADGNTSQIYLPGNISVYATFLGTYYPDYRPTQRIGMIPDIELRPTIAGIRAGKDELLDYALQCSLLGIEEIRLFPNPVSDLLTIQVNPFNSGETTKVEIIDLFGRHIGDYELIAGSGSIDLTGEAANAFIVRVTTGQQRTARIVFRK